MTATASSSLTERTSKWYDPDLTEVNPHMRKLLEGYSKVPSDEVVKHINLILTARLQRERGFAINPYPCIGHFKFLTLTLLTHPRYGEILHRLRSSFEARYLDIGCCFGQDLRQLAADGVDSTQLSGLDIESPLMQLGYEFFLDSDTLKSKFAVADVLKGAEQGECWTQFEKNKADVVHCSAVLHLFPLADQLKIAINIARLVRKNGIIVGRQSGSIVPAEKPALVEGTTSYRHNVESFQRLWDQAGEVTDTKWKVEGSMDLVDIPNTSKTLEDVHSRRLLFTVIRTD